MKFQGFAEAVWKDIGDHLEFWIDTAEPNFTEELKLILAKRAYDLVSHSLFVTYADSIGEAHFPFDLMKTANDIPDLTELPPL